MSRSKMDPVHISQVTFDENLEAMRVALLPTEIEFDTHSMTVHDAKAGDVIDTSNAVRINVIAASEVLMVIADQEISLGVVSGIKEICTPAIKIMSDSLVVVQG